MSSALQRRYSPAEYLALERQAAQRSEYIDGAIYAMAGGTARHALICDNLLERIKARLRGSDCRPVSSSLRIKIEATSNYTYPDLSIVCGQWQFEDSTNDCLLNPRLIIEVLSPSTERHDRGWKFRNYQLIPSFEEYVLVSQEEPRIERFSRQGDVGWLMTAVSGLESTIRLESVHCDLPLSEIYEDVAFGPSAE
jgi:Uma2 family endonuclease